MGGRQTEMAEGQAKNAFTVRLIATSMPSTIKVQKDTDKVRSWMDAFVKGKYLDIDINMDESIKDECKRADNGRILLPQVQVKPDGVEGKWEFLGDFDVIECMVEEGELKPKLQGIAV